MQTQQVAIVMDTYGEARVPVRPMRFRGQKVWNVYAPGWRSMHFKTEEAAVAKLQRHPGFVRMEAPAADRTFSCTPASIAMEVL